MEGARHVALFILPFIAFDEWKRFGDVQGIAVTIATFMYLMADTIVGWTFKTQLAICRIFLIAGLGTPERAIGVLGLTYSAEFLLMHFYDPSDPYILAAFLMMLMARYLPFKRMPDLPFQLSIIGSCIALQRAGVIEADTASMAAEIIIGTMYVIFYIATWPIPKEGDRTVDDEEEEEEGEEVSKLFVDSPVCVGNTQIGKVTETRRRPDGTLECDILIDEKVPLGAKVMDEVRNQ